VHLLVTTDGQPLALHAAAQARILLTPPTAVTVLAVVSDVPGDDAGGIEGPTESAEQAERRWTTLQADAAQAIRAAAYEVGVEDATPRVEIGDPGPVICVVAEEIGADLVVVGSHGRGFLKQLMLGSVSEHVVRHAPCPVLVVHGADHERPPGPPADD
jgi:nucleotide-binding universal stress UspA family protein